MYRQMKHCKKCDKITGAKDSVCLSCKIKVIKEKPKKGSVKYGSTARTNQ
jgi:hypothetical protein